MIPAMVVVLAFAAAQLRWLRNLPRRTAGNLILAGVVFVGAAAGLETIESAMYEAAGGVFTYAYDLVSMVEEVGELWAEAWVLSTLLLFVLANVGAVKIAAAKDVLG